MSNLSYHTLYTSFYFTPMPYALHLQSDVQACAASLKACAATEFQDFERLHGFPVLAILLQRVADHTLSAQTGLAICEVCASHGL